jgi:hypothetical protein
MAGGQPKQHHGAPPHAAGNACAMGPAALTQNHAAAPGAAAISPAGAAAAAAAVSSDAMAPSASGGRISLASQGSGSVLLHGSVSDTEFESLPWLADSQLGLTESQELQQLLASRPMGLLPPDELLARES